MASSLWSPPEMSDTTQPFERGVQTGMQEAKEKALLTGLAQNQQQQRYKFGREVAGDQAGAQLLSKLDEIGAAGESPKGTSPATQGTNPLQRLNAAVGNPENPASASAGGAPPTNPASQTNALVQGPANPAPGSPVAKGMDAYLRLVAAFPEKSNVLTFLASKSPVTGPYLTQLGAQAAVSKLQMEAAAKFPYEAALDQIKANTKLGTEEQLAGFKNNLPPKQSSALKIVSDPSSPTGYSYSNMAGGKLSGAPAPKGSATANVGASMDKAALGVQQIDKELMLLDKVSSADPGTQTPEQKAQMQTEMDKYPALKALLGADKTGNSQAIKQYRQTLQGRRRMLVNEMSHGPIVQYGTAKNGQKVAKFQDGTIDYAY